MMGYEFEVYSWEDGVEELYWQGENLMGAISAMEELSLQGFKYIRLEWRPR
jgi:hypothetical protein